MILALPGRFSDFSVPSLDPAQEQNLYQNSGEARPPGDECRAGLAISLAAKVAFEKRVCKRAYGNPRGKDSACMTSRVKLPVAVSFGVTP